MANKIKVKRATEANVGTLEVGEVAFLTDAKRLVVGSADGNQLIGGDDGNQPVDLSSYATKNELDTRLDGMAIDVLTKAEYEALSETAKSDASKLYMLSDVEPVVDLTDYATIAYVDEQISNVPTGGTVDLTNYVTNDVLNTRLDNISLDVVTQDEYDALDDTAKSDASKLYIVSNAKENNAVDIGIDNGAIKLKDENGNFMGTGILLSDLKNLLNNI